MQVGLATRLLEANPGSLPLLLLRGHAHLLASSFAAALRCYLKVRSPVCTLACVSSSWSLCRHGKYNHDTKALKR